MLRSCLKKRDTLVNDASSASSEVEPIENPYLFDDFNGVLDSIRLSIQTAPPRYGPVHDGFDKVSHEDVL